MLRRTQGSFQFSTILRSVLPQSFLEREGLNPISATCLQAICCNLTKFSARAQVGGWLAKAVVGGGMNATNVRNFRCEPTDSVKATKATADLNVRNQTKLQTLNTWKGIICYKSETLSATLAAWQKCVFEFPAESFWCCAAVLFSLNNNFFLFSFFIVKLKMCGDSVVVSRIFRSLKAKVKKCKLQTFVVCIYSVLPSLRVWI